MKTTSKRAFLFKFKINGNSGYIVEFGEFYIRLFAKHGQVMKDNVVYELPSPYSMEDLWNQSMECCNLQVAQNGDVLYIFHQKYMKKLVRYANDHWQLEDWELNNGPWNEVNVSDINITASQTTGTVELTATGNVFMPTDTGRLIRLTLVNDETIAWQPAKEVGKGDIWTSDGKYYKAMSAGTTGNVKPVHSNGMMSDGAIGWQYLHSGYGTAKISQYISPTKVKAEVKIEFPENIYTSHWELGMIKPGINYPISGCFYLNRFWMLVDADDGLKAIGSFSGDFNNFADKDNNEVTAECAITVPVNSKEYNAGRWIAPGDVLFVGTSSGEFYIDKANSGEAMSADNTIIKPISSIGSKPIQPIAINGHLLFVDRFGTSIRDLIYSYERDGYDPLDVSILSRHLLQSGIVAWDWQDIPNKLLWIVVGDGRLIVFTFDSAQQVMAMSQQYLSGAVETVAVIPSFDEHRDDVWCIVKRKIDNVIKRYVEWIDEGTKTQYSDDIESISDWTTKEEAENEYTRDNCFYVDSGVIFNRISGDTTTKLTGLDHLIGCEVAIAANGMERPHQIVSMEGTIDIEETDTKVVVGLAVKSSLTPQFFYLGSDTGRGLAEIQRIDHLHLMVYRSAGGRCGDKEKNMLDILYHQSNEIFGTTIKLFTGMVTIPWNGRSSLIREKGANMIIENESVYPMHILAVVPSMSGSR